MWKYHIQQRVTACRTTREPGSSRPLETSKKLSSLLVGLQAGEGLEGGVVAEGLGQGRAGLVPISPA